jgi:hypothetical protein
MSHNVKSLVTGILFFTIAGCSGASLIDPFAMASGAVADYEWTEGQFNLTSEARIAVTVSDQREYILSGNKEPTFTGLARAGFGEPFDVATESGRNLTEDIAISITSGLNASQIQAQTIITEPTLAVESARRQLVQADADRFLHVILHEWKTDTYHSTKLEVNIELVVYGDGEAELLRKTFANVEEARSGKLSPKGRNAEIVSQLYPRKLAELLEDFEVASALAIP